MRLGAFFGCPLYDRVLAEVSLAAGEALSLFEQRKCPKKVARRSRSFAARRTSLRCSALSTGLAPTPALPRTRGRETNIPCSTALARASFVADDMAGPVAHHIVQSVSLVPTELSRRTETPFNPLQRRRATEDERRSRASGMARTVRAPFWRDAVVPEKGEFRSQAVQPSSAGNRAQRGGDAGRLSLVTFFVRTVTRPPGRNPGRSTCAQRELEKRDQPSSLLKKATRLQSLPHSQNTLATRNKARAATTEHPPASARDTSPSPRPETHNDH
jgi:hypothetical protein